MKKGWIIALALLLIGFVGAWIWYSRLKNNAEAEGGAFNDTLKPRLEMSTMNITSIDDDRTHLTVEMLIDNPLPVGFKANRLNYTVLIANTPVIEDTYAKPIEIESRDSTLVKLPMVIDNKKLLAVLKTLDQKDIDSTTYTVRSSFDLDVPILGDRTFRQTITRRMPTFYLPEIKVEDINFGKVGLKETDVATKVSVVNKNRFPFNFTDTHYTVSINGKEIADGSQPEPVLIRKQATTPVVFPVTLKPGQTLALLPKMLFDKKDTPFLVTFTSKLVTEGDNPMFKNSVMKTRITGTLADFKKD
ncbi:LEA type 2 family protein [Larkinella soli]|uniref:LEA type 2 family protein n=1 Tax=Larkinella soli TaxID=1770527 RepID=UPI000FFB9712|nr:LEA type 2 family protein [Larkinella soli]